MAQGGGGGKCWAGGRVVAVRAQGAPWARLAAVHDRVTAVDLEGVVEELEPLLLLRVPLSASQRYDCSSTAGPRYLSAFHQYEGHEVVQHAQALVQACEYSAQAQHPGRSRCTQEGTVRRHAGQARRTVELGSVLLGLVVLDGHVRLGLGDEEWHHRLVLLVEVGHAGHCQPKQKVVVSA